MGAMRSRISLLVLICSVKVMGKPFEGTSPLPLTTISKIPETSRPNDLTNWGKVNREMKYYSEDSPENDNNPIYKKMEILALAAFRKHLGTIKTTGKDAAESAKRRRRDVLEEDTPSPSNFILNCLTSFFGGLLGSSLGQFVSYGTSNIISFVYGH